MPSNIIDGQACIPNISTAERLKRLAFGVMMFLLALAVLTILVFTGVSHWWRLAIFPLFISATTGFFQWRDKTCVGLAARGSRKLGVGAEERIVEPEELAHVRRQVRKVNLESSLTAIVITLIAFILPVIR